MSKNSAYATFIEDCRQERARLIGLIGALEGNGMNLGVPISIPGPLIAPTAETLVAFQHAVIKLNALIDAFGNNSGNSEALDATPGKKPSIAAGDGI